MRERRSLMVSPSDACSPTEVRYERYLNLHVGESRFKSSRIQEEVRIPHELVPVRDRHPVVIGRV